MKVLKETKIMTVIIEKITKVKNTSMFVSFYLRGWVNQRGKIKLRWKEENGKLQVVCKPQTARQ